MQTRAHFLGPLSKTFSTLIAMKVVVVVGNNLLDTSHVKAVALQLPHDVLTCNDITRIKTMLLAGPGDREFTIIFDYAIYEKGNLDILRHELNEAAFINKIKPLHYRSFAPHEKIQELSELYPGIEFVPRSRFFANLPKYLS